MKGRILVVPLVLLLGLTLAWQTLRWRDRMTVSRGLRVVEALTMPAYKERRVEVLQTNVEVLRQAARRDPLEVGVPTARGSQHLLLGQWEAAIDAYQESLRLEPRPETYIYLGLALDRAKRPKEAAEAFRLGLRIDPRLLPLVPLAYRDPSRAR